MDDYEIKYDVGIIKGIDEQGGFIEVSGDEKNKKPIFFAVDSATQSVLQKDTKVLFRRKDRKDISYSIADEITPLNDD